MNRAAPVQVRSPRPFLVVTPLGLGFVDQLADALAAYGVRVAERRPIRPWSRASTSLYVRSADTEAATRALRFEEQWRTVCPADRAESWQLLGDEDYARLRAHKATLRQRFPGLPLRDRRPGEPPFRLHAFHVPDPTDLPAEARRLGAFATTD